MLDGKTILVTGGTGSFGNAFTRYVLENYEPEKIIIYSRDEYKQFVMRNKLIALSKEAGVDYDSKLRFFIGDVRDEPRLRRAFKEVDYVVHAAALKQVPACEYNPAEAVKTNIDGAVGIINAALDSGVQKVIALSTDKAVNPVNLYGGTKLVSDKLFVAANAYRGQSGTTFSVVRYGNVAGSRGSVIPFFDNLVKNGATELPITDFRMTRFWISLDEGIELVIKALEEAQGGETYISKIPSFKVTDLATALAPNAKQIEVGIREGEKLHECMVPAADSMTTYEYDNNFVIYPHMEWCDLSTIDLRGGKKVARDFVYDSGTNTEWLSVDQLGKLVAAMDIHY
ncbi:UDP-N-acetylglucosamine 4,6-dehydratase (inverting) [Eggerthella guodeyinii]|uniref:UDP-N-acetylglucosamine 4,6-dehydratase (Inverting) n=1 Tax=Eggerthella guodeyinii TaxID=2690837 RepID=A0A6N7RTG6_9ACTN|nr:UDP-N-acetylglucosamine 4,6-dehydratase (inverting) [Eggerthella guodeyinii]MRX84068.1 UDP-N-acetylglucosamine 4,6-dehydratase (inverting) [Eggerthella guodeyinii]